MCIAEGLLRIPDKLITLEFVFDKLANKKWHNHLGRLKSFKGKLTTFGLYFPGAFADVSSIPNVITKLITKIGEPLFLNLLKQAIKFLSKEFIFGFNISEALENTAKYPTFRFAFDLLGESARTEAQSDHYYSKHWLIANHSTASSKLQDRPNLSAKLTALYPRVEFAKIDDINKILLPKLMALITKIKDANLTITFDAEEYSRQDIYLHILTKIITDLSLKDFEGIGL